MKLLFSQQNIWMLRRVRKFIMRNIVQLDEMRGRMSYYLAAPASAGHCDRGGRRRPRFCRKFLQLSRIFLSDIDSRLFLNI